MATAQTTATRAPASATPAPASPGVVTGRGRAVALATGRVLLGFVFLWSFLDSTFGLYSTSPNESWIAGDSPTSGYLGSLDGTFAGIFQPLAGQVWVDWMFMLGMALVGSALILGVAMRLAAVGALALMGSLWLTSLPLDHNPFVDEHVIYAVFAVVLAALHAGNAFGAGGLWSRLPLVRRTRWLA
jgi:thiosulfate dehydrogenase (quinone) large subunit